MYSLCPGLRSQSFGNAMPYLRASHKTPSNPEIPAPFEGEGQGEGEPPIFMAMTAADLLDCKTAFCQTLALLKPW